MIHPQVLRLEQVATVEGLIVQHIDVHIVRISQSNN